MSTANVSAESIKNCGVGFGAVREVISYNQFTDGGSTTATYNMKKQIPAGSLVLGSKVNVLASFNAATSAVLGIQSNAYSGNTTHNIKTVANNLVKAAFISTDAGIVAVPTATTVALTVTTNGNFSTVTTGKIEVWVFYLATNVE